MNEILRNENGKVLRIYSIHSLAYMVWSKDLLHLDTPEQSSDKIPCGLVVLLLSNQLPLPCCYLRLSLVTCLYCLDTFLIFHSLFHTLLNQDNGSHNSHHGASSLVEHASTNNICYFVQNFAQPFLRLCKTCSEEVLDCLVCIQFWFLNQEILVSWKMIYLYPVVKFCQPVVAHIILFIRAGCNISICNITASCNFNHWLLVTTCYIQYFVLFQEVGSKLTIWYKHLSCFVYWLYVTVFLLHVTQ